MASLGSDLLFESGDHFFANKKVLILDLSRIAFRITKYLIGWESVKMFKITFKNEMSCV